MSFPTYDLISCFLANLLFKKRKLLQTKTKRNCTKCRKYDWCASKKESVLDNTVRASNLFTYKNQSEERAGGGGGGLEVQKRRDWKRLSPLYWRSRQFIHRIQIMWVKTWDWRHLGLSGTQKQVPKPCILNRGGGRIKFRYEHEN